MSTRRVRLSDHLAIHFRCDICGQVQVARYISCDEMLEIISDPMKVMGEHCCINCMKLIENEINAANVSEWERNNGLHD